MLTLSLPVTRICVNFSTVYDNTLVAKGLNWSDDQIWNFKYIDTATYNETSEVCVN